MIVPAGNRKEVIEDCLKSVRWADELIVVDSLSTDGTLEVARKYADRILRHEYGFSARQKNWAIPQAAHEWVLLIDTDERVTGALKREIEEVLSSPHEYAAFRIPRLNWVLGKEVRHAGYYPDYQIRLFRRDKSRYQMRRVHAHMNVDGKVGYLEKPIVHYAHRSVDQTLRNLLVLMTTWEAEERREREGARGKKFGKPRLFFNILARPVAVFLYLFLVKGGWKDGMHGLFVSAMWGFYASVTYMKIWEQGLRLPEKWWERAWKRHENPGGTE